MPTPTKNGFYSDGYYANNVKSASIPTTVVPLVSGFDANSANRYVVAKVNLFPGDAVLLFKCSDNTVVRNFNCGTFSTNNVGIVTGGMLWSTPTIIRTPQGRSLSSIFKHSSVPVGYINGGSLDVQGSLVLTMFDADQPRAFFNGLPCSVWSENSVYKNGIPYTGLWDGFASHTPSGAGNTGVYADWKNLILEGPTASLAASSENAGALGNPLNSNLQPNAFINGAPATGGIGTQYYSNGFPAEGVANNTYRGADGTLKSGPQNGRLFKSGLPYTGIAHLANDPHRGLAFAKFSTQASKRVPSAVLTLMNTTIARLTANCPGAWPNKNSDSGQCFTTEWSAGNAEIDFDSANYPIGYATLNNIETPTNGLYFSNGYLAGGVIKGKTYSNGLLMISGVGIDQY